MTQLPGGNGPGWGRGAVGSPSEDQSSPASPRSQARQVLSLGATLSRDRSGGGGAGEAGSGSPERRRETGRPHGHTWSRGDTRRCSPFGPQLRVLRAAQVQPCHPQSLLCLEQSPAAAPTSVQSSRSVVSDSLQPRGLQHTRPPCPSPTPGVYPNSCP